LNMRNILPFLLFLSMSIYCQKEANIWYFGENAGLDFNSGTPIALLDGQLNTIEGCASISDVNGNLLFYSDGSTVWNRNHKILLNGSGLLGDTSSTQSVIIVPKPLSNNIYYVFTVDKKFGDNGINYSELNINLDNGLGGITSNKNIQLSKPPTSEKLSAIKHPHKNEYWVVSRKSETNEFIAFKVSNLGVTKTAVVSPVGETLEDGDYRGALKISPNGRKIAICTEAFGVELFDFDIETGIITNPQILKKREDFEVFYGIEFSPSSNLLYIGIATDGVFQFNLKAGSLNDIKNSLVQIAPPRNKFFIDALQLGPDGKIYCTTEKTSLDIIKKPNIPGIGCNYVYDGVDLNGRNATSGLPQFIQSYFFSTDIYAENVCFQESTKIFIDGYVDTVVWDFGDSMSGVNNTSNEINTEHIFSAPGKYTVTCTATSASGISVLIKEITIFDKPIINLISEDVICMKTNPRLQISIENPNLNYSYTWRDENDIVVGNSAKTTVSKGGKYRVVATSINGCESDEATINIKESSKTTISIDDISSIDNSVNNFIKINTTNLGVGDYKFRLLDSNSNIVYDYQEDSIFENLNGGAYRLEVNDKDGCGAVFFEIVLISSPKFFSPNGDNQNDYWQVSRIDKNYYKSGIISIFNRYGLQIAKFTIDDLGWDGTFNGKVLSSNNYWYKVVLVDQNDDVKTRTGNFSLIRN
jgi:gliding motility-associated-like protein